MDDQRRGQFGQGAGEFGRRQFQQLAIRRQQGAAAMGGDQRRGIG
jgi:hypothetical protein